jgi:D-aminopeptidase
MSNFGVLGNLRIDGRRIFVPEKRDGAADKGSIIMIIGTDLPLSDRQLRRTAKRAAASLGRVGSYLGTGSGDIAIAFSNGNIVPHYSDTKVLPCGYLFENDMDTVFEATVEVVEESIISSLYHAESMTGIRGKTVHGLKDYLLK